jgi:hypothetical protein
MKETDLRDMFKVASKSNCTSTVAVSTDPLSTFSALKTPENTEYDPDNPAPADDGDNHETLL